jgi:nitrogen fixation/metabolism regulation signal transduction histidine kinase
MFALGLAVLFFSALHNYPSIPSLNTFFKEAPLRSLIHAFFLIFILMMLVIIGYVTGQYFLQQFNKLAKTTVHEKMDRISDAMNFLMQQNKISSTGDATLRDLVRANISELAEEQDNEVNIYDRTGDLIASSQPSIFEKGIISKKINPRAFFELRKETKMELVTDEQIGDLKFYSGYVSIRSPSGEQLMYINLPYYNSRKNLNDQVGFFFIALVNILVIAVIIAGFMAPLISRQITARLAPIAERFKKMNVGAINEPIDWPARDEIGSLVNEYNKMIVQVGQSADKLAHTQRQLAWREMAQQVAHEIKNPLTPMKLSIQHLLRAYQNNAPNLKELTENVARNLIEQIDTLSDIASEFSNYASMPKAELENLDVNEVLKSTCALYAENDVAAIHLHSYAERSSVVADKSQLIRVFNNLLLNALQSIPTQQQGEIDVITENVDGQIVISVRDNGIGIPAEEMAKVFIPNFTTKSSGTGLGLALSRNIIESFGGTISFKSQRNAGTTFFIRLPLITDISLS